MSVEELLERQLAHMEKLEEDLRWRRSLAERTFSLNRGIAELHRLRNEILMQILEEIRLLRATGR